MALTAHYRFRDNAADAVITDSAGTNTGTLVDGGTDVTSAHQAVGPSSTAFEFDGADDKFTAPAAAAIDITGHAEYSVAAWVRLTTSANQHTLLAKAPHVLRVGTDGGMYSYIAHAGDDAIAETAAGVVSINEGKWVMIVITYNEDAAKKIKHYIDGVLVANADTDQAGTDAVSDDSGAVLTVGSNDAATSHFLEGKLADYRIYDHALTAHEIKVLYDQFVIWEYDDED